MAEVKVVEVRPEDVPIIPKDPKAPHPKEIKVTGKAGSVAVINGSIWHGGTLNESGAPRRVLHLAIGRRDLPQQLNEREHLTPELYERTNAAQRFLLDIEGATPKVEGLPAHAEGSARLDRGGIGGEVLAGAPTARPFRGARVGAANLLAMGRRSRAAARHRS